MKGEDCGLLNKVCEAMPSNSDFVWERVVVPVTPSQLTASQQSSRSCVWADQLV